MKPNRDADALAASLTNAAKTPLPLPKEQTVPESPITQPPAANISASPAGTGGRARRNTDNAQITLRPARDLLDDYTFEAAERTKIERRVVSAQEIMLEVLERGRPRTAQ